MKMREARARKLLSMRALAEKAGVSLSTIQSIEDGRYLPRLTTVQKLSQVLDVQPEEVDEFRAAIEAAARGRKPS